MVGSSVCVSALMSLPGIGIAGNQYPAGAAALERARVGSEIQVALLLVGVVAPGAMLLDQRQDVSA